MLLTTGRVDECQEKQEWQCLGDNFMQIALWVDY